MDEDGDNHDDDEENEDEGACVTQTYKQSYIHLHEKKHEDFSIFFLAVSAYSSLLY